MTMITNKFASFLTLGLVGVALLGSPVMAAKEKQKHLLRVGVPEASDFPHRMEERKHEGIMAASAVRRWLTNEVKTGGKEVERKLASVGQCVEARFNDKIGGTGVVCSAGDVSLSSYELISGPASCLPGEQLDVVLKGQFGGTANERYDIGIFVATDGGNAKLGVCYNDYLDSASTTNNDLDLDGGSGPFYNAELTSSSPNLANTCGDILSTNPTTFLTTQTVSIKCQDSNNDGMADVGTCTTWANQDGQECMSELDTTAETKSKCSCGNVEISGLTVPKTGTITVNKVLSPSDDSGKFNLQIDSTTQAANVGDGGTTGAVIVSAGTVPPGTGVDHTVGETAGLETNLADYTSTISCTKSGLQTPDTDGTITVLPGDDWTCTITNTLIDPCQGVVCDDGNSCTTDACDPANGNCVFTNVPAGEGSCDDNDACTSYNGVEGGADACDGEGGCDGTPIACDDGNACTTDACDPADGFCDYTNVPAGEGSCDDENACTSYNGVEGGADACDGEGGCDGTPIACDDGNACTTDACDPADGFCDYTNVPAGEGSCDDENACTSYNGVEGGADACDGEGGCDGTPIACDDGNACTTDACDPADGFCDYTNVPAGEGSCDDENACTSYNGVEGGADACDGEGGCDGTPIACDDGNACTTDACDPADGFCDYTNVPAGEGSCDDENACTSYNGVEGGADACDGEGGCDGTPIACDDGNACTTDACDPADGFCDYTNVPAGEGSCDDENACTSYNGVEGGADACDGEGGCDGTPIACDDGNACTTDACDPADGFCDYTNVPAGEGSCDDENACTSYNGVEGGADACDGEGGCDGTPIACDDGNACTTDACDPADGFCDYTNVPAGEGSCDDENACTSYNGVEGGADACDGEGGCDGTPIACDDGNACTTDACDPADGFCDYTNVPAGEGSCDDENACTSYNGVEGGADACDGEGGCDGTPIACDDGNACTTDACDPADGFCDYTNVPAGEGSCDDENACTSYNGVEGGADACDGEGGCDGTPIACDDGNACTTDACDPADGFCDYTNVPAGEGSCDDENDCTSYSTAPGDPDKCDGAGNCLGNPVVCPGIDTGASDLTVECDGAGNQADLNAWLASNGGATASDICGGVTWSNDFAALSDDCGATGSATVTFTATDDCGNSATTSATFTIEDNTLPSIDTSASDLTVECDGAGNQADLNAWLASNGGALASDICGGVVWSNDFTALSDDCGATGSATVTFTATDDCGNSATTSATFTIEDTTPPSIDTGASDLTVECDGAGNQADLNAWLASNGGATASDICGGVVWSNDFTALSDDCGATGSATVTFTATDDCGRSATTSATFTIEDTTPPSIDTGASDLTVECDGAGNQADLNAWLASNGGATASDICGGVVWSNDFTALSDDCGATGSATVTFTATDDCGRSATTSATFTIEDTTPPSIDTGASDLTVECDGGEGNQAALVAWLASNGGATASDICGGVVWSNDFAALSDDCGATGSATVTFTATDDCGRSATTSATFTIEDNTKPSIDTFPDEFFINCDGSNSPDVTGYPTGTDACGSVQFSQSDTDVSTGCCPLIERTWTATDECGNTFTDSRVQIIRTEIDLSMTKTFLSEDETTEISTVEQDKSGIIQLKACNAGSSDAYGVTVDDLVFNELAVGGVTTTLDAGVTGDCTDTSGQDISCTFDIPTGSCATVDIAFTAAEFIDDSSPLYGTVEGDEFRFVFLNGYILEGSSDTDGNAILYLTDPDGVTTELPYEGTKNEFSFTPPNPPGGDPFELHISCSDLFINGYGSGGDQGPIEGVDDEWRISTWSIVRYNQAQGAFKKCGDVSVPLPLVNEAFADGCDSDSNYGGVLGDELALGTADLMIVRQLKAVIRNDPRIQGKKYEVLLENVGLDPLVIIEIEITYPPSNGQLVSVDFGGRTTIYNTPGLSSPATINEPWLGTEEDRTFAPNTGEKLNIFFQNKAGPGEYLVKVTFEAEFTIEVAEYNLTV